MKKLILDLRGNNYKYPEKSVLEDALINIVNVNDKKFYRTYTDKNGKYLINNIKKGEYKLYCFDDVNNNLLLDTLTEIHGFYLDTILVSDKLYKEILLLINQKEKHPWITKI